MVLSSKCNLLLIGLCAILTSHGGGSPSREDLQLVQALLRWPVQYSFPGWFPCISPYIPCYYVITSYVYACASGLDILRLALLSENGLKFFFGDSDNGKVFLGELFAFAVYV